MRYAATDKTDFSDNNIGSDNTAGKTRKKSRGDGVLHKLIAENVCHLL